MWWEGHSRGWLDAQNPHLPRHREKNRLPRHRERNRLPQHTASWTQMDAAIRPCEGSSQLWHSLAHASFTLYGRSCQIQRIVKNVVQGSLMLVSMKTATNDGLTQSYTFRIAPMEGSYRVISQVPPCIDGLSSQTLPSHDISVGAGMHGCGCLFYVYGCPIGGLRQRQRI